MFVGGFAREYEAAGKIARDNGFLGSVWCLMSECGLSHFDLAFPWVSRARAFPRQGQLAIDKALQAQEQFLASKMHRTFRQ